MFTVTQNASNNKLIISRIGADVITFTPNSIHAESTSSYIYTRIVFSNTHYLSRCSIHFGWTIGHSTTKCIHNSNKWYCECERQTVLFKFFIFQLMWMYLTLWITRVQLILRRRWPLPNPLEIWIFNFVIQIAKCIQVLIGRLWSRNTDVCDKKLFK